jgi:UDP-glucose-4-epimerase GalE
MSTVLVTGGAGYIGCHMVKALRRAGHRIVILDNLVEGHRAAVADEELIEGDLNDKGTVRAVFRRHRPGAVFHFAASCSVGESVANPLKYYGNNTAGTLNLLEAALEVGTGRFVFSSTAALYGEPQETPITEQHPLQPINPYGWSKLMGEQVLRDLATAYGVRYVAFRYFNAAGADVADGVGEDHRPETHLIPLAIKAALDGTELKVFGTDYDTRDGSCVRDYVHVKDLVEAHLLGLEYLDGDGESTSINLGTETGTTVLEIIDAVKRVTGLEVPYTVDERRPGDPAVLVASNAKAKELLGWEPKRDLDTIIRDAYDFFRRYPAGFPDLAPVAAGWPPLQPEPSQG